MVVIETFIAGQAVYLLVCGLKFSTDMLASYDILLP